MGRSRTSFGNQLMRVVIIGGVAGGMSAATRMRRLDAEAEIIVIEKSGHVSYANCGLPYYVGGVIEEEEALLLQTPASLHARFRLDVRIASEVTAIDAAKKTVQVFNEVIGESYEIEYDKLVLSPGASPVVPPIPGIERALTLRTVEDVEKIFARVEQRPGSAVVIGGGFIGVEIAENLIHKGIATTVVEASSQLLAPLDPEIATLVAKEMERNGVNLYLGTAATNISPNSVQINNGVDIPAELIILAIGVRPDTKLAKDAGLTIGTRGGISVDEFNRTSNHDIYAVGDVAEKTDAIDGSSTLVPLANLANRHGRVVADHIAGRATRPVKTIGTAIVKVFDLMIAATGWNEKRLAHSNRSYQVIHSHPNSHASYYPGAQQMSLKLIFDSKTGEILGAQGIGVEGVDKRIDVIATAIRGGITAPELADLELAYAPPFGSAKDAINMLGYISENILSGLLETAQWNQIEEYREKGFELLDVRTPSEFAAGSIPGAKSLPVDEIRNRVSELKNKNILVNCQVGQRGHTASMLLKELGFNAVNLDGGYLTWSNSPASTKKKEKEYVS
jgi:NADPH-dependent 2,4-dienoyl-CoA reductase/sulfur reductase-like enzyme/rhodanese-related sulfurtransferase